MSDFLDRLKKEKEELDVKLNALDAFIKTNDRFNDLSNGNKILLIKQRIAMTDYSEVLQVRLELLK